MKIYWPLLLVFMCGHVFSQDFYFRKEPPLVIEDVRQINIIFQAEDQMIWLGTDKGVFWYDGRRYRQSLRPDQQLKKVTCIAQSRKGLIWAGYEDGYIHTMSAHGNGKNIVADSLQGSLISGLLFNNADQLFITTYGKGIWQLDGDILKRVRFRELAQIDDIYDALFDQQGRLWLATDNGIWIYQSQSPESLSHIGQDQGLPDEIVTQLEMSVNGDIWIGLYDHGLAYYDTDRDIVIPLMLLQPSLGNVIGLCIGQPGEGWMATEKSIVRYNQDGSSKEIKLPSEMKDRVGSLLYDVNGNLWVANGNKIFVANTRFEYTDPGLSGIQSLAISKDKIWIGCESGLYGMNRQQQQVSRYLENEKINILSMYTDDAGMLWIGTFGQGLYCFDPRTEKHLRLTEKNGLSNNSILNIDGHGETIWLATLGGISEVSWKGNPFNNEISITGFNDKFNFPEVYVYDVFAAPDGKIWFGTDGKGLYVYENGQFRSFETKADTVVRTDDHPKTIYSIAAGQNNTIWISGVKGQVLQLSESGQILDHFQGSQGLIKSLVRSGVSEMLMIREEGIHVMNRFGQSNLYAESSGLSSFTPTINAAIQDKDGSVWIADTDRILHYVPCREDTLQHVRMHLRGVSPGSLLTDQMATLEADSNFIDIRYTGLWYQDPASVRYRYRLIGHDHDWIYTQDLRAVYSGLSPGQYTFILEGSHSEDFSNAPSLTRQFVVIPPFYLRWWFIAGTCLLITWIAYSYFTARIKRLNKLHELEREKTMLRLHAIQAQVNPHFLFNSFNTLAGIIEENQEAAVDYVDQLSGFFRGVLTHRNAELIRLEEELEMVRNYIYILQKRYGTNLLIHEEIAHAAGWIAPLSIQMLVENAIKHNIVSAERPLSISIVVDQEWVSVSNPIQPKINAPTESTGFGLSSLVARYVYLTRRKIEIRKEQNTFTVRIPIIYNDKPV
ncbi:MAG TPA: histidine kinase [Saprospiraceae bacterium]|nr:histidine kinase [Saprospiraceae bacterium]